MPAPIFHFRDRVTGELVAVVSPLDDVPDDPDPAWLKTPPRQWRVQRYPVRWQ